MLTPVIRQAWMVVLGEAVTGASQHVVTVHKVHDKGDGKTPTVQITREKSVSEYLKLDPYDPHSVMRTTMGFLAYWRCTVLHCYH